MKKTKTHRGFDHIEFEDSYNEKCSIQKSSLATAHAIWLGVDDASPQIMASQAAQHGVDTAETTGWVPFPIHEDVLLTTRMHLTQEKVAELLPILQKFVDTGEISD